MSLITIRCGKCGSDIRINTKNQAGICPYCKTEFYTKESIIKNVTNISVKDFNSADLGTQMLILETLMVKYYLGEFRDKELLKSYSATIKETDNNNILADLVIRDKMYNSDEIISLFEMKNFVVLSDLFVTMLGECEIAKLEKSDLSKYINDVRNERNFELVKSALIRDEIFSRKDYKILLRFIRLFRFSEEQNTKLIDILLDKDDSDASILFNVKLFHKKHEDFKYDVKKIDEISKNYIEANKRKLERLERPKQQATKSKLNAKKHSQNNSNSDKVELDNMEKKVLEARKKIDKNIAIMIFLIILGFGAIALLFALTFI